RRAPLAYLPMRTLVFFLIAFLSIVDLAWSQASVTPSAQAAEPMFRPVLIGQASNALINRIDEHDLVRKGQEDALVMFMCAVQKDGGVAWTCPSPHTPDSRFRKQESPKTVSPASAPTFIPNIYNHQPV